MSVSRMLTHQIGLSSRAFAFAVFLSAAPGVATAQELEFISNFQIVSTTIDVETDLPTITFTFDCLLDVEFVRLRSTLVQQRGQHLAESRQTQEVRGCLAGTTATLEVTYGFQASESRFKPGPAELDALLTANVLSPFFTVDSDSITMRVLLHPEH